MRKKMKYTLIAAVLAACALSLAACGEKKQAEPAPTQEAAPAPEAAPPAPAPEAAPAPAPEAAAPEAPKAQ